MNQCRRSSPPPCGEGSRVGVARSLDCGASTTRGGFGQDWRGFPTPTPTPPHKGEGKQDKINFLSSPPPCGYRVHTFDAGDRHDSAPLSRISGEYFPESRGLAISTHWR